MSGNVCFDKHLHKKVLMIHEVRPWMFELPLSDYVLTFDDGLYSQFYFLNHFLKVDTIKYFFISTNIICPENIQQSLEFPDCRSAHEDFFRKGNPEHYMKWSQIKKISKSPNCIIGGHSHFHGSYSGMGIKEVYQELIKDSELMLRKFAEQNLIIEDFCLPYNKEQFVYREILLKLGIKKIFGDERIAIETLR